MAMYFSAFFPKRALSCLEGVHTQVATRNVNLTFLFHTHPPYLETSTVAITFQQGQTLHFVKKMLAILISRKCGLQRRLRARDTPKNRFSILTAKFWLRILYLICQRTAFTELNLINSFVRYQPLKFVCLIILFQILS